LTADWEKLSLDRFASEGFLLTPPAWPATVLAALAAEVRALQAQELASLEFPDDRARELNRRRFFLHDLRFKCPAFAQVLRSVPFRRICTGLLGPDVDTHYDAAIIKSPRDGHRIDWHQNEGLNVFGVKGHLTCFTAVTSMTVENGCLWILPDSHRLGRLPHVDSETAGFQEIETDKSGAVPIEMEPGQILAIHPLLLHASGPNTAGDDRIAYVPVLQRRQAVRRAGRLVFATPVFRRGRPVFD
jgi:phytanoyl-CoA hydroxylase